MSLRKIMQEENQEARMNKLRLFARRLVIVGLIISIITIILTVIVKAGSYRILSIRTPFFKVLIIIYCIITFAFLIASFFSHKLDAKHEKGFYRFVYFYDLYDFFMKCVCVLTLIMVYAFSFIIVDGPSMEPTYSDNDILIVRTIGYSPKANDVSIIYMEASEELYIKRIVAVPGDVVKYENGTLYVNDKVIIEKDSRWGLSQKSITLGEEEYFIVGDNYSDSYDSRSFGPVKGKNILAKVAFKLF